MRILGRVEHIDWCIHRIVAALNAARIETEASCRGHLVMLGSITLADGRTLIIRPTPQSMEEWGKVVEANECDIPGNTTSTHQPV